MNKPEFKFWINQGCDYLNDCIKNYAGEERDSLFRDFHKLDDALYSSGKNLLSMTDQVRIETRLRNIKKKLDKKFDTRKEG